MKSKLKSLFEAVRNFTITSKEKAVAAFVAASVSSYMAQNGLTYHDLLTWSALWALVCGVVAHAVVYFTRNSVVEG